MRTPKEIKKELGVGLKITWDSGVVHSISNIVLRKNCPSADGGKSKESKPKGALSVINSTINEATKLVDVWPVGSYAVGIRWADGHDTGIYTFDYLYDLGEGKTREN